MTAWRFKRIRKDHKDSLNCKKWIFSRLKDEIRSISKLNFFVTDAGGMAIEIHCGKIFVAVITISDHDMKIWDDDDLLHSLRKQILQMIMEAEADEFV